MDETTNKGEDWYPEPNAYDMLQGYIDEASEEFGVSSDVINAMIHAESSFTKDKKSRQKAMGYMQITPDVAKKYGVTDPYDPVQNIRAGTQYISDLMEEYDGDLEKAIKAYHMGPTAVAKGKKPGKQTRGYLKSVTQGYKNPAMVEKLYKRPREGWKKRSLSDYRRMAGS